MNIKEYVMSSGDTNYVPIKYAVMEAVPIGGDCNVWLKVVGYGIDTEEHYNDYVDSIQDGTFLGSTPDGLQGTLNEYVFSTLDGNYISYHSKNMNHEGPYLLG